MSNRKLHMKGESGPPLCTACGTPIVLSECVKVGGSGRKRMCASCRVQYGTYGKSTFSSKSGGQALYVAPTITGDAKITTANSMSGRPEGAADAPGDREPGSAVRPH